MELTPPNIPRGKAADFEKYFKSGSERAFVNKRF
jgi:hypothetical protein